MPSSLQQNQALLHVLPFQQSGRSSMVADNWWLTLLVLLGALCVADGKVVYVCLRSSYYLLFYRLALQSGQIV